MKKPCEYCEEWWQHVEDAKSTHLVVEFYPEQEVMAVSAIGTDEDTGETEELELSYNINYCPFCGRKLN